MKKLFVALILSLLCGFASAGAAESVTPQQLRQKLSAIKSPKDSLRVLYDIFDLSKRSDQPAVGREIYGLATRLHDDTTRLDIIRLLTASVISNKGISELQNEVSKNIPESELRKETELFLKMKKLSLNAAKISEEARQKEIARLIASYDKRNGSDKYQHLLDLFTLVEYLRNDASGNLLVKYMDKLSDLVETGNFKLRAIPNIIYAEATNIYSSADDPTRAIAADRKLLKVIDALEKYYRAHGRNYRNYDISRYVSYRRMIRNSEALAPGETEALYSKIKEIAARNPDVAADAQNNPLLNAFYLYAKGDYAASIPYLKAMLAKDNSIVMRRQVLDRLVKAAQNTGDEATLVEALKQQNALLTELHDIQAAQKYRELQIKYDVKELLERNNALELQNKQEEITSTRRTMSMVIFSFIAVGILLVILLFYWTRYRAGYNVLRHFSESMKCERDNIRNSHYFDYDAKLNYDEENRLKQNCRNKEKKNYISDGKRINDIFNDILYIASVGRRDRIKYVFNCSLDGMMREIAQTSAKSIKPEVKFDVNYPEEDFTLITDKDCLVYIVSHLIRNAAEFTDSGQIDFSGEIDLENRRALFIVTDSGDRLAHGNEHLLFSDFVNLDKMSSEKRSGMFLCRLNAMLLRSELFNDQSFKEGTRFIFRTPLNLSNDPV